MVFPRVKCIWCVPPINKSSWTFGREIWMINYQLSVIRTMRCDTALDTQEFWASRTRVVLYQLSRYYRLPLVRSRPSLNIITRNTCSFFLTFYQRFFSSLFRSLKKSYNVRIVSLSSDRNIANARPVEYFLFRVCSTVLRYRMRFMTSVR